MLLNLRVSCRYLNSGAIALGLLSKVFMQLAPLRSFVLSSLLCSLYFGQWKKKWYTDSSVPLHARHVGESALPILCMCFVTRCVLFVVALARLHVCGLVLC